MQTNFIERSRSSHGRLQEIPGDQGCLFKPDYRVSALLRLTFCPKCQKSSVLQRTFLCKLYDYDVFECYNKCYNLMIERS